LNHRVNRIVAKDGKVYISYLDTQTNRSGTIEADEVVSTIPLFRLFEVQFEPDLSQKKRKAIETMGWGAYFKAHIFVPKSAEKFWTRNGSSILPILSDSNLGVIYDGNPDQKTDLRVVSLLITGDYAENFNMMPLDRVRAELYKSFDKFWPGFTQQIKDIEFYRFHPRAIAAWPPSRSRFDDLSNEIRRPENHIYFAGDFTESSHSDGAFISAQRVVRQIKAEHEKRRRSKL
jgi:monoamine oxidase